MRIGIISDSRGFLGTQPTWIEKLISKNKSNSYFIFPKYNRLFSLFEQVECLENKKEIFDLMIFQTAYHEYICPWSIPIFKMMLGKYDQNFERFLVPVTDGKFKGNFHYRNVKLIKKTLNKIVNYCKNSLYIDVPYNWADLKQATIEANNIYKKHFSHNLPMSMDPDFVIKYTMNTNIDKIHYNSVGSNVLSDNVLDIIEKIG